MTTNQPRIPPITLGWRLQLALVYGGVTKQEMAEALGVNRATVSRWMHDKGARPRRAYVLQWATETGVDQEWLEHGTWPVDDDDTIDLTEGAAVGAVCAQCGDTLPYPYMPADVGASLCDNVA